MTLTGVRMSFQEVGETPGSLGGGETKGKKTWPSPVHLCLRQSIPQLRVQAKKTSVFRGLYHLQGQMCVSCWFLKCACICAGPLASVCLDNGKSLCAQQHAVCDVLNHTWKVFLIASSNCTCAPAHPPRPRLSALGLLPLPPPVLHV